MLIWLGEQVDAGPERPGSLDLLGVVLDPLHQADFGRVRDLEAGREQRVLEGQVEAQVGALVRADLQFGAQQQSVTKAF